MRPSRTLSLTLRVLLALVIVGWVFSTAELDRVVAVLLGVELLTLGLLLGFFLLENLMKVLNWRQLLGAMLRQPVRFVRVLCANLTGGFLGTVVPSSAGTDVVRAFYSRRLHGGHVGPHAASILVLNLLNWFAGALIGVAALMWLWYRGVYELAFEIVVLMGLLVAVAALFPGVFMLLRLRRRWVVHALRRVRPRWFGARHGVRRFVDSLRVFERSHVGLPRVVLVALACVAFQGLAWGAVGRGFGVDLPVSFWLLMVPVSGIANVVPLSIIGLGFNQAAHFTVLSMFGVAAAEAVAISTLMVLGSTAYSVSLGSLAFAASTRLRAPEPVPAAA